MRKKSIFKAGDVYHTADPRGKEMVIIWEVSEKGFITLSAYAEVEPFEQVCLFGPWESDSILKWFKENELELMGNIFEEITREELYPGVYSSSSEGEV